MARAFHAEEHLLVAELDQQEREIVRGLCEQVRELVRPANHRSEAAAASDDPFEAIVAGLGDLSTNVPASPGELPGRDFGGGERDPALDRLFPAGNRQDEAEAAEYRRFTEQGLRQRKHDALGVAIEVFSSADDRVTLDRAQAPSVLIALTDVRLVMGERIGLRTDEDADRLESAIDALDEDDPALFVLAVYDFLTWLQESLTRALTA